MEANTWKGTKEKVRVRSRESGIDYYLAINYNPYYSLNQAEHEANAKLFTDALETVQKCGKLPSELLEHNQLFQQQIDDLKNNKHQF